VQDDGAPDSIGSHNAAVDAFNEVGYSAAERGPIIERAEMTKGARYHHFDSMESLASAIIEEGSATVLSAFRSNCEAPRLQWRT
jgi:AcrR family transcriptional regulator